MPDVDLLIELADFYDVDIREILDGERKGEAMDRETKDALKKVAAYAAEESARRGKRLRTMLAGAVCLMLVCWLLFGGEYKGKLYGVVPESVCSNIMSFVVGLSVAGLVLYALHSLGALDRVSGWKKARLGRK